MVKTIYYNETNTCDRCIEEDNITKSSALYSGHARREYNLKGDWTGRWICDKCRNKGYTIKTKGLDIEKYKTKRIINGKIQLVVVDKTGRIINLNPNKEDLKILDNELRKPRDTIKKWYTDKELLDYLRQFINKYRKIPTKEDFNSNPRYPSGLTYQRRFGSWSNALKLVELDVNSLVKNGILNTCQQKARLAEIKVINHFKEHPVDLSGEDQNSPCDGICPNRKTYDVKGSGLHKYNGYLYYHFRTNNKYKDNIEIYYFLAFNKNWSKLDYVWRVPGEIIENTDLYITTNTQSNAKFNIENMEEYNITDKF